MNIEPPGLRQGGPANAWSFLRSPSWHRCLRQFMRLGYSSIPADRIDAGVRELARLL